MKDAIGDVYVLPWGLEESSFNRLVTVAANVVLPVRSQLLQGSILARRGSLEGCTRAWYARNSYQETFRWWYRL